VPWVRLDDHFFHNRKARSAGPQGRELLLASVCYCTLQLNDGTFTAEDLPVIAALAQVEPSVADLLTSHGMWHLQGAECALCRSAGMTMPVPPGHIAIHEYLVFNPSRSAVLADREAANERQRRSREKSRRDSQGTNGVTSAAPSRPVPNDLPTSSSGNSRAAVPPVDNPDDGNAASAVPEETWDAYAELKLRSEGNIRNPVPWKRTCKANAKTELGQQAQAWWAMFELTPRRLAECLADGQAPRNVPRRQEPV